MAAFMALAVQLQEQRLAERRIAVIAITSCNARAAAILIDYVLLHSTTRGSKISFTDDDEMMMYITSI